MDFSTKLLKSFRVPTMGICGRMSKPVRETSSPSQCPVVSVKSRGACQEAAGGHNRELPPTKLKIGEKPWDEIFSAMCDAIDMCTATVRRKQLEVLAFDSVRRMRLHSSNKVCPPLRHVMYNTARDDAPKHEVLGRETLFA